MIYEHRDEQHMVDSDYYTVVRWRDLEEAMTHLNLNKSNAESQEELLQSYEWFEQHVAKLLELSQW